MCDVGRCLSAVSQPVRAREVEECITTVFSWSQPVRARGEELYILVAESQRLSKQQRKYMHAATTSTTDRMFLYHKPTNLILVFGRSNVKGKQAAVLITVVPYKPKRERYKSRSKTRRKWKKRD